MRITPPSVRFEYGDMSLQLLLGSYGKVDDGRTSSGLTRMRTGPLLVALAIAAAELEYPVVVAPDELEEVPITSPEI